MYKQVCHLNNKITYILVAIVFLILNARGVYAQEMVDQSASLKQKSPSFDYRVANLENYLESHNSPLSEYAEDFVFYADNYDLDYRMVPAIAGVESTFGKRIPRNSYNAYGWANGEYKFSSWEDSIEHVSMTLKTKYIERGASSISRIAKRYAPPSTTWGGNVKFFMKKIDSLPVSFLLEG